MDKAMRDVDKLLQMVRGEWGRWGERRKRQMVRGSRGCEGGRGGGDKLLQMVRGAGGRGDRGQSISPILGSCPPDPSTPLCLLANAFPPPPPAGIRGSGQGACPGQDLLGPCRLPRSLPAVTAREPEAAPRTGVRGRGEGGAAPDEKDRAL